MDGFIIYLLSNLNFKYVFTLFFAVSAGIGAATLVRDLFITMFNNIIALIIMKKQALKIKRTSNYVKTLGGEQ